MSNPPLFRRALARRYAVCLGLAALMGLTWVLWPALRSQVTGLVMLFTQRSALALEGWLKGQAAFPATVALSVFPMPLLPHLSPLLWLAARDCLGAVPAALAALLGGLGAVLLWGGVGSLLSPFARPGRHAHWAGPALFALAFLQPAALGLGALCAGCLRLPLPRRLGWSAAALLPAIVLRLGLCTPYRTLLPDGAVLGLRLAAAAVAVLYLFRSRSGR